MKTTKVILIWSIVIGFLAQGFGQFTKFDPSNTNTVWVDSIGNLQINNSNRSSVILATPSRGFSVGGYDSQDAKIIDSKIENGVFEIEVDFSDFDGYMCLVLNCQDDHKKHTRIKYYFNASDFSFIRREVGELKEVMTKQWIYKQ